MRKALTAERSSALVLESIPACPFGMGVKRSAKDVVGPVVRAAEAKGALESTSAIQAAAPSDSAIAAKDNMMVSPRPMRRRRDNSLSACLASETIRSPNRPHPPGCPTPSRFYTSYHISVQK